MGRPQKAVTCFYHILTLDAEYGEVWLDIGAILFEMGQTREATLCYQKALHVQHGDKKELSRYTLEFLSKNSFYKDNFNKFLDASSELKEETLDSPSTISKIMQML
jgi:tetratricopeptide (TPR) repeat protein